MDKKSKDFNITNEGGYDYTTRYLKNIMGLWLIQETRRQLGRMGQDYSYAQLEQEALKDMTLCVEVTVLESLRASECDRLPAR